MTDLQEKAMRMAYEVMTDIHQVCEGANHKRKDMHPYGGDCPIQKRFDDAWEALRQALSQPEQEPVGTYEGVMETMISLRKGTLEQQQIYTHMKDKFLYTAPQKREWVGLTDEQMAVLNFMLGADELDGVWFGDRHPKEKDSFWWRNRLRNAFQDADIEAKLKEKNT